MFNALLAVTTPGDASRSIAASPCGIRRSRLASSGCGGTFSERSMSSGNGRCAVARAVVSETKVPRPTCSEATRHAVVAGVEDDQQPALPGHGSPPTDSRSAISRRVDATKSSAVSLLPAFLAHPAAAAQRTVRCRGGRKRGPGRAIAGGRVNSIEACTVITHNIFEFRSTCRVMEQGSEQIV